MMDLKRCSNLGTFCFRAIIDHVQSLSGFFYNQTVYKYRIIGLICSINLLKPSLFLKFNTFINILIAFHFNSSHSTPMNLSNDCFVLWICCCVI